MSETLHVMCYLNLEGIYVYCTTMQHFVFEASEFSKYLGSTMNCHLVMWSIHICCLFVIEWAHYNRRVL